MDEQHRQALEALQQQLKATQPATESAKARMDRLKNEIGKVIETSDASAPNPQALHGLRQTLEHSIEDLEAHHPALAEALRVAVNTLVNSGV